MALNSRGNPALALQVRSITVTKFMMKGVYTIQGDTVCQRRLDPFYMVSYCIKWIKISWTVRERTPRPWLRTLNHVYVTSCETHRRTKTFMLKYRFFLLEKVNIYSLNTWSIVCILPFFYMWQRIMYISYINNCMLILGV